MAISNYQAEKQFEPWMAKNDFFSLNKVFGFGSKNNYSISYSKENGLIAWIAGPYVILYDISLDKQISFIKNPNNKILSCLRFSDSGLLLATGEGNCKNGEIRIYEIYYDSRNEEIHFKSILNYKIHKYGIDKLLFFRNDSYILSIGSNEDKYIIIFDIKNKQNIFSSRFNRPILACDVSDDFMILCGNGFIKIYNYKKYIDNYYDEENKDKNTMSKSLIELSKLKGKSFISVVIDKSNDSEDKKIFLLTYDCYLVEMKSSVQVLNRWVHLKSSKGISLIMWNNLLGCGCGDGVYRIFTNELKYICTLKTPPPLGKINTDKEININSKNNLLYADVIASLYNNVYNKLLVIYSDKTFIAWDINNIENIEIYRTKIFHCGGIEAMDYFVDKKNNIIKIVTCSDDKTVIFWSIPIEEFIANNSSSTNNKHIFYSNYIRHIFYLNNKFDSFKVKQEEILSNSYNLSNYRKINNTENENDEYNLTSIRFSPCGNYIAIGDTFGNILIFSLINFEQINKIEAHNGEVNSIDMINDSDNMKLYLSSGSSDNLVSLIDMSDGFSTNPNVDDKTIMEKMSSPVISVVFCIDKNKRLKLIVGEQNSSITFFQIINGILQSLQKNYDDKLKTYCLSYSPSIKKIISGHNGKISIWKTSTNIAHKHFQVNKGDKLLDNFRIASDSSGLMFATSNDDKMIRIRALHDGKLLSKIQISESISSLFFILDDNYLIATSIEGYLFFFKLNQNLIKKLKKDNELINSTEERNIINNKLKLLQKFMENDTSLSKNSQVKNLLNKFQQSEEATIEDLKLLDGFVKDGKKNHKDISDANKKPKEVIELKEEKNNDDQENQNINEENKNNNKIEFMNKSNIFERGLRDRASTDSSLFKKNIGRISLTDNYNKKSGYNNKQSNINNQIINEENNNIKNININLNINKNNEEEKEMHNNNDNEENEENEENNENDENGENNEKEENDENKNYNEELDIEKNKYNNININEEYSNNNKNNLNNDINEEIDENQSNFNEKIINNSQTQLSETHLNNLIITQTSYAVESNYLLNKLNKKPYIICNEIDICYWIAPKYKYQNQNLLKTNTDELEINNYIEPKDKLINSINNNIVDNIDDNEELKELEMHVEKLLAQVRCKLGNEDNDPVLEKMIEKYSKLIIEKINKNNDDNDDE